MNHLFYLLVMGAAVLAVVPFALAQDAPADAAVQARVAARAAMIRELRARNQQMAIEGAQGPGTVENADLDASAALQPAEESHTEIGINASPTRPLVPVEPNGIRFDLADGSIVAGTLSIDAITVETRFGTLRVPIESIRSFRPGLDSYSELGNRIRELIERLGSEDYAQREAAKKELLTMGGQVLAELRHHQGDTNIERARHVKEILAQIEAMNEAEEQAASEATHTWIRPDTVVTTDFTVLGSISPKSFELANDYGQLSIKLSDIRTATRFANTRQEVRRSIVVEGRQLVQRGFKDTDIHVERGDRVTIVAQGQIAMTPWGGGIVSTPDGGQNFGWYKPNEIPGGALVGRIGDSGPEFKVGSKHSFTADRSGPLRFAIGMQQQFARPNYNFPGQYEVRVTVKPAEQ